MKKYQPSLIEVSGSWFIRIFHSEKLFWDISECFKSQESSTKSKDKENDIKRKLQAKPE